MSIDEIATLLGEAAKKGRTLVAIAGPPGSGKSTFASRLRDQINATSPGTCAVLPMDGYHFDDSYLKLQNWQSRKGAPFTFDVGGLRSMLSRLKANREEQIAIPLFDREIEIARAGAEMISKTTSLILVEGNYLLLDEMPWRSLHGYFDKTLMLETSPKTLRSRLEARWTGMGLSDAAVDQKLNGNDLKNANLVTQASKAADYVVNTDDG